MVDRKDAEELLDSVRLSYSAEHEYVEVYSGDFKFLDLKYYDKTSDTLSGLNFRYLGDMEDRTLSKAWPKLRTFFRSMISHDGVIQAFFYHMTAVGWWRIQVWLGLLKSTKALDFETEFTDGCFISTTNAIIASAMTQPPEIKREYYSPKMSAEDLLEIHKQRVRSYLGDTTGIACVRINSLEEAIISQRRGDVLKAAHRDQIQGGLLPEEMDSIAKGRRGIGREVLEKMQELEDIEVAMFLYSDGNEVREGDHLRILWQEHGYIPVIVKAIIAPGSEMSGDYSCVETGGVLLEDVEGKAFGLMLEVASGGRLNEDYEFVSRAN